MALNNFKKHTTGIVLIGTAKHSLGKDSVTFSVGGRRYQYDLDDGFLDRIEHVAKHKPGKALNIAKKNGILIKEKI